MVPSARSSPPSASWPALPTHQASCAHSRSLHTLSTLIALRPYVCVPLGQERRPLKVE
jgi:hypothetical protein